MAGTSVLKLTVDDKSYNASIKEARKGLLALEESLNKAGKSFSNADKSVEQYVREIGKMETSSKNAKGRISELSNAFVDLSTVYNRMSKQMQQSDVGKALEQSLQSIKQRAVESKRELERLGKELETTAPKTNVMKASSSDLSKVLSELGSKYGVNVDMLSGAASKASIYTAAISATVVAVSAAAKALNDFNVELDKQQQVTTVTTGLKGPDADSMTATARALSDTYGVDFREVINAANTLMTQFGESGAEAMQLIREGMQGMIEGDGPKLLSMIQQYAPSFRDAGISASQLVAIIQNSEGGIFTDQNMNAIVMGIKNIRLMTQSTSEALAKMGIDGQKMSQDLSAGTITIFDALQTVAQAIESTSSSSQEAGEVMQQVFGRQGSMAGTKLGEAIATLNTNLEETKKQTGEVGESLDNLVSANERLNTELMKTFGYDGWNAMANEIKANLIVALADTVEGARRVKDLFVAVNSVVSPLSRAMKDFGDMSTTVLSSVEAAALAVLGPLGQILTVLHYIGSASSSGTVQDAVDKANRNAADKQKLTVYLPAEDNWRNNPQTVKPQAPKVHTPKVRPFRKTGGGGGHTNKTTPPPPEGSIDAQRLEVQKLEKAWNRAATDALRDKYLSALKDARKELDRMTGKTPLEGSIDAQAKKVSELQAAWKAAANDDSRKRISAQIVEAEQRLDEMMGKVEQAQGISITNQSGMTEYINMLQQQLSEADFGGAIYKSLSAQLTDMTTLQSLVAESLKVGLGTAMFDVADELGMDFWTRAMEGGVENIDWQAILDKINEKRKEMGLDQLVLDFDKGTFSNKDTSKKGGLGQVDKFVSGLSSVSSGLQQMGIKLPDGVTKLLGAAQGLMTVIQGVNSIISIFSSTTATAQITAENANSGMLAGLTAAVEGLQMTIAAKTFLPGLANGGIVGHAAGGYSVPGNSYSGDNIPIMANAGEVVLNRAQTGVLASALSEQSAPATSTPYVSGEKIYLGMENYLKRIGRGEIVTSRH
jgi:hypothetical protein